MAVQGITILGATGSVGRSTLEVLSRHPERFEVIALTGYRNVELLARQCARHGARYGVIADEQAAGRFQEELARLGCSTEVLAGSDALEQVAALDANGVVMAAIVGAAGLRPALAAVQAGKRLLLANKEAMVIAGGLFRQATSDSGARIIPVDSEHNALFQLLPPDHAAALDRAGVLELVLTASGGPFLRRPAEELGAVTPEQACDHPTWDMGRKISVDSATLMNKGLEVIEAHWLFGAAASQIRVVVHPQSIVHSMVAYRDGSVLAHLGVPDMRTPIAHALAWPERIEAGVRRLNISDLSQLEFLEPDLRRFPCLGLAFTALQAGGSAPVTLNAANECAVEAFLDHRIRFTDIRRILERALERMPTAELESLAQILEHDAETRAVSRQLIEEHG